MSDFVPEPMSFERNVDPSTWAKVGSPERPVWPPEKKDWCVQLYDGKGRWQGFVKDEDVAEMEMAKPGHVDWTYKYEPDRDHTSPCQVKNVEGDCTSGA